MPGDVGAVSEFLKTLLDALIDENKIPELAKRHELASLKQTCLDFHARHDLDGFAAAVERLQSAASKP